LWIGQGKSTLASRFRFVQRNYNMMVQFFGGIERTNYTLRYKTPGSNFYKILKVKKWLNMNPKPDKEYEKTL